MPWRQDTRPYYVLVSELMLQQTQVDRVIPKFEQFIAQFPDEATLAAAPLADVLRAWQGLGYNRRAKFLHEAAKSITSQGNFPQDETGLLALPGVGINTAGAIRAYAYNQPAIYIETNVRAVYIHHFFHNQELVDDKQIRKIMLQTVPWAEGKEQPMERIQSVPGITRKLGSPLDSNILSGDSTVGLSYGAREFYWALMDYGSLLKRQGVVPGRSSHYKKQAPLQGSLRQVRGQIVTFLAGADSTHEALQANFAGDVRFVSALAGLVKDGLVVISGDNIHLTK